jgi:arylsulfatase A-like enzyme
LWVRLAIDLGYVAGLAAAAGALDRLHPPSPQASAGQAGPRVEIAAGALACTMVALALTPLVRIAQWEPSSNASDHRPNVILITLDTVRADHLSLYGYGRDTTPGLRHLPATVYANASATSNWTVPTIASILTGQSPLRHGAEMSAAFPEGAPLASTSVTIAEVLQKQRYHTAAIVANPILDPELGFDRGFSSYDLVAAHFDEALTPISREYLLREALRGLAEAIIVRRSPLRVSADAGAVNTKTGRLLETLARRPGPFFLFLNSMDAHSPYTPPPPYDTRYPGKDPAFRWSTWGSRPLRDRERDHLTSQYDGAIAHLDEELGHLIERLRQLDLFDNSLIVIVGDHGEAFGEHGVVGHGSSLYQTQLHVPLLVKYPQARTATTVSTPVSGIDILPTVLDVIHAPVPAGLDGRSLRTAGSLGPRWIISESFRARGDAFTSRDAGPAEVSLSYESLKLILGAGGGTELYDLAHDSAEEVSLDSQRRVGARWRQALHDYLSQAAAPASPAAHLDKDMRDRLRALGYLR